MRKRTPSKDSDQPAHLRSLNKGFVVPCPHEKKKTNFVALAFQNARIRRLIWVRWVLMSKGTFPDIALHILICVSKRGDCICSYRCRKIPHTQLLDLFSIVGNTKYSLYFLPRRISIKFMTGKNKRWFELQLFFSELSRNITLPFINTRLQYSFVEIDHEIYSLLLISNAIVQIPTHSV